jgi:hypothetical protein
VSNHSLRLLFALLLAAGALFVFVTAGALPERVATNFGPGGYADASMTRAGYRVYMLLMSAGFPVLLVGAIGWLPRLFPRHTNVPHRDYWMAPARQQQAFAILERHALWLGCAVVVFACAMHWLLLDANARTPPRLPLLPFLAALALILGCVAAWGFALHRALRRPDA